LSLPGSDRGKREGLDTSLTEGVTDLSREGWGKKKRGQKRKGLAALFALTEKAPNLINSYKKAQGGKGGDTTSLFSKGRRLHHGKVGKGQKKEKKSENIRTRPEK